jgi:hypothetical protein
MRKKGSLDLSVNSIIVFVLAFAMLGVGLYFTNMIKDRIAGGTIKVLDLNDLKNPPDASNTITVPNDVTIKRNKPLNLDIGFYNKANTQAEMATIGIKGCLDDQQNNVTLNVPTISSPSENVDSTSGKGFKVILTEKGLNQGTYICTMYVYKAGDKNTVYDTKQFFLTVAS